MIKNKIHENRIKAYFLDSAVSIIRSEGIRSLSVRNLAEKAGYSYATLYNYFESLDDLVSQCIDIFIEECVEFVRNQSNTKASAAEIIKSKTKAYMNYFIQYTGTYELLFLEKLMALNSGKLTGNKIAELLNSILSEEWKSIRSKSKNQLILIHSNLVNGLMLNYLNRRLVTDYREFINQYEVLCDSLFSEFDIE